MDFAGLINGIPESFENVFYNKIIIMFKLQNVENRVALELLIEGYQFPDVADDDWCLVRAVVTQGDDVFEVVDPALETTDIIRILDWFKCLAARKLPRSGKLSFIEPCLTFEFLACREDAVRISISLSHEMKPDFVMRQFGLKTSDWKVVFELGNEQFNKIIADIEAVLQRCPVRDKE